MGKIIQFKNKPQPLSYGQYYYENENDTMQSLQESDGVKKPYDKFSNQILYTTVVTDEDRDLILNQKFKFIGLSNIEINKLVIDNAGVNHKVKNTLFRGFVFDKNTFDCFTSNGELKNYDDIDNALYTNLDGQFELVTTIEYDDNDNETEVTEEVLTVNNTRLYDHSMFFNFDAPRYDKKKGPGELDFLTNQIILEQFESADLPSATMEVPLIKNSGKLKTGIDNFDSSAWNNTGNDAPVLTQPFNPMDGLGLVDISERQTSIFSEDGQNNYLQFVIWTKGDARRVVGTKKRRRRLYVFKVNIEELFDFDNVGNAIGKSTPITFENYNNISGGGGTTPAFIVSSFSVTINTTAGASINNFPQVENNEHAKNILESVVPPYPIKTDSFDQNFINTSIFTEPRRWSYNNLDNQFGTNFTPTAFVTIKDKLNQNLQAYKISDLNRQICSVPSSVELKINISKKNNEDSILLKNYPHNSNIPPYYKFCVVDWNDIDDNIKTVKDALNLKPLDFNQVLKKQNNNTFIFEDIDNSLYNSYSTPGIKQIKVLIFNFNDYDNINYSNNYNYLPSDESLYFKEIEPLRYKLMTIRIFLDIPVNQFPDFGEVGGADYKTIPWPYTTPIINGVDDDSKYNKSINDVLGSGKIGNTDIIDETFLSQAKLNNELGKTIEKFDLEQCRYFNSSYSIYDLLGINAVIDGELIPYDDFYWDGDINKFSEESSVEQIFISDNQDNDLKQNCKLEFNLSELTGKSVLDTSGNSNKGLLIGDYKIKKIRKGEPMIRDSFIKVPKKTIKNDGAL